MGAENCQLAIGELFPAPRWVKYHSRISRAIGVTDVTPEPAFSIITVRTISGSFTGAITVTHAWGAPFPPIWAVPVFAAACTGSVERRCTVPETTPWRIPFLTSSSILEGIIFV